MSEMVKIPATEPVEAYVARPKGTPKGAVIVIHEVWGLVEHIKSIADRVAAEGYLAVAPNLLGENDISRVATPDMQEALFDPKGRNDVQTKLRALMAPIMAPEFGQQALAKLRLVFDYVYDLPEAHRAVAVWGFCFGGTYSFSLAVAEPRLAIALPFYGHSNHTAEELAQITCPVRLYVGEKDERLMTMLPDVTRRMEEAGVDFEAKVYPGCGHAFFNDSNKFAYNKEAATDAWERVKQLLAEYLGS